MPLVLRGLLGGAQLEPVEGARAGQRMAPVALPQTAGVAVIDEAGGQAPGQADALVDSLQQQGATIGGHAAAVKASAHLVAALIGQIDCDTVCAHGVCLWLVPNLLNTNRSSQIHTSCSRPW